MIPCCSSYILHISLIMCVLPMQFGLRKVGCNRERHVPNNRPDFNLYAMAVVL